MRTPATPARLEGALAYESFKQTSLSPEQATTSAFNEVQSHESDLLKSFAGLFRKVSESFGKRFLR